MKVLLVVALIAAIATVVLTHNATMGKRQRGDKIILSKSIIAYPKLGTYQDRDIKYNPWFFKKTITAIKVTDNFRNESGPTVELLKGGIGKTMAVIKLHSKNSHGINATVTIFGK